MKIIKTLFILFIMLTLSLNLYSNDTLAIVVGSYGVGIKSKVYKFFYSELKIWPDSEVTTYSLKGAYNKKISNNLFLGGGLEISYINFNTEGISGNGGYIMPLGCVEYFILQNMSLNLELGISFITLKSQGQSVSGPEFIANVGINIYIK